MVSNRYALQLQSVLKAILIGTAAPFIFSANALFAQSKKSSTTSSSEQTRQDTVVAVTGKVFFLSAGAELMFRLNAQNAFGIVAEAQAYVVDSQFFTGFAYQRFFGNSFFARFALGVGDFSEFDSEKTVPALDLLIGNEWIVGRGLILGADWIGGTLGIKRTEGSESRNLQLPRLRVGYTF